MYNSALRFAQADKHWSQLCACSCPDLNWKYIILSWRRSYLQFAVQITVQTLVALTLSPPSLVWNVISGSFISSFITKSRHHCGVVDIILPTAPSLEFTFPA